LTQVERWNAINMELSRAQGRLQTIETEILKFTEQQLKEMQEFHPAVLDNLRHEIGTMQQELNQLQSLQSEATACQRQIDSSVESLAAEKALFDKLNDRATTFIMPEAVAPIYASFGTDVGMTIEELERRQSVFDRQQGQISELENQIRLTDAEIQTYVDRVRRDEIKRNVISELEKLAQAFSRKGIPVAYLQYKFNQLARLTQRNLAQLDANFAVEPDPNESVSFQFRRIDHADDYVMPQKKLSGGQRVRLSIAFLLAFQQKVLPGVGLLVLDEPSMHLDTSGVEELRDMLISLSQKLQNSDAQVIVCDHHPALMPAFQSVIRLS